MGRTERSTGARASGDLAIRRATDADLPAIIALCRAALGWVEGDPNEAFFDWKHRQNPFGRSPAWVSVAEDGTLAGLRVFLRWRFRAGEETWEAVRAVDTATHPDWQGRGIFTSLTLGAIPDLRGDGVDMIFNTPNDKSRPGYLKMGWSEVGRVPVAVRPRSVGAAVSAVGARTAAEMWSEPTGFGESAPDVLSDDRAVAALLAACGDAGGVVTDRSPEHLRWRYRFEPLRYRAVLVGRSVEDGIVIFRLRRRGGSIEGAVTEVLVPGGRSVRPTMSRIVKDSGADYLLRCAGWRGISDGFVPVPRMGPVLTWRPIGRPGVPSMDELALTLGDIELF